MLPEPECTSGCVSEGSPQIECPAHGIKCDVKWCGLFGQHTEHRPACGCPQGECHDPGAKGCYFGEATHGIEVLSSGVRETVRIGTEEQAVSALRRIHPDRDPKVVELLRYHGDGTPRRSAECAKNNPDDHPYWPGCCRFPKSCSPVPYAETPVTEADLEPRRP